MGQAESAPNGAAKEMKPKGKPTASGYMPVPQVDAPANPFDDEVANVHWLVSHDEEIGNAMLVSTIVFTAGAAGIISPHEEIVSSTSGHTELYGAFLVISLVSCLAAILFGTMTRRLIKCVLLHQKKSDAKSFISDSKTRIWLSLSGQLMWVAAISLTLAMMVNVHRVLGSVCFIVFMVCTSLLMILLVCGFYEFMQKESRLWSNPSDADDASLLTVIFGSVFQSPAASTPYGAPLNGSSREAVANGR